MNLRIDMRVGSGIDSYGSQGYGCRYQYYDNGQDTDTATDEDKKHVKMKI